MRAIETFYDGYKFRSRTEARWADFLKTLGIEYRYEYEGFLLVPPGEPYLPDFYLPELGYWIEVKGTVPNEDEQRKAGLLNYGLVFDAATENQRVYILYGDIPWPNPRRATPSDTASATRSVGTPPTRIRGEDSGDSAGSSARCVCGSGLGRTTRSSAGSA